MELIENTFVTHTCRVCENAFVDVEILNTQNIPPTYRACEQCVKSGHKYEDKKQKEKDIRKDSLYTYVLNNIPDELNEYSGYIVDSCIGIADKNPRLRADGVLNRAIEVLNYYLEDNDFSFKKIP